MKESKLRARLRELGLFPHQVEFAEAVLSSGVPSRVILSDSTGLGMSGSIAALIAALKIKTGAPPRCFIAANAKQHAAWLEAIERFSNHRPTVIDPQLYRRLQTQESPGSNPWSSAPVVVASMDFIKTPGRWQEVESINWDVAVIDDAHLCLRDTDRGRLMDAVWKSQSVARAVAISRRPGVSQSLSSRLSDPRPLVFLRSYKDLITWTGNGFMESVSSAPLEIVTADPSPEEYDLLGVLIRGLGAEADKDSQNRFARKMILRRFSSSLLAFQQTLERRLLSILQHEEWGKDGEIDLENDEDQTTRGGRSILDKTVCSRLLSIIETIEQDSKWQACREILISKLSRDSFPVVIFTEFLDTAEYVNDLMVDFASGPHWIMTSNQSSAQRATIIDGFKKTGKFLVATSGIVEGLDLGFVNSVIHYDIPWEVDKLLARLSRVERAFSRPKAREHFLLLDNLLLTREVISGFIDTDQLHLKPKAEDVGHIVERRIREGDYLKGNP